MLLDFLCSEEDYVKVPLPIKLFYALSYSLITSKCGKNKQVALEPEASLSLMCLPHFDVMRDLVLNRPTATWNLFVLTEASNPEAYNFVAVLGFFTCQYGSTDKRDCRTSALWENLSRDVNDAVQKAD